MGINPPEAREKSNIILPVPLTISELLSDPSRLGSVADSLAAVLEERHNTSPINFSYSGWLSAKPSMVDDGSLLRRGNILVAKATKTTYRPEAGAIVETGLDAVFLKWCSGNKIGQGKWVYFTVDRWNVKGEPNPLPHTSSLYRDLLLELGLPVSVASFRGLERERKWRVDELLNLNAVVYGPDGQLTGRTVNSVDFDEEGVLVKINGGNARLYKGQ